MRLYCKGMGVMCEAEAGRVQAEISWSQSAGASNYFWLTTQTLYRFYLWGCCCLHVLMNTEERPRTYLWVPHYQKMAFWCPNLKHDLVPSIYNWQFPFCQSFGMWMTSLCCKWYDDCISYVESYHCQKLHSGAASSQLFASFAIKWLNKVAVITRCYVTSCGTQECS